MADYKVGNLQIAFEAINETASDFDKLKKSLQAIRNLISNIANADVGRFSTNIKKITNNLSPFLTEVKSASAELSELGIAFKELGIYRVSKVATDFKNISQAVEESTNEAKEFNATIGDGTPQLSAATFEIKKLSKELNNNSNATSNGAKGWKKFIKSIGRIALYRTIRRALQLITQSITETIQEFAKIDDNVNDTMSHITSSLQVIKLSFGAIFLPLLEAIEPILSQIAEAFANFANMVSQATAKGNTYWAINTKAIRDYREQLENTTGSLASFDKIQSLNAKDTFSFFEEREVDKQSTAIQGLGDTIQVLKDIISGLWTVVSPVLDIIKNIILGVSTVVGVIKKFIDKLKELGLTAPFIALVGVALAKLYGAKVITGLGNLVTKLGTVKVGVLAVFAAIGMLVQVIDNWGNMNTLQKVIAIVGVATTAFFGLAMALGAFHSAWSVGLASAAIIGGIIAVTAAINSSKKSSTEDVSFMAAGGIPSVGTLFYAGEAGAETVTVGNSGRTEVTNVSQMETALYNALVRYGRENRGTNTPIVVQVDGKTLLTTTRREANKIGLDFART